MKTLAIILFAIFAICFLIAAIASGGAAAFILALGIYVAFKMAAHRAREASPPAESTRPR